MTNVNEPRPALGMVVSIALLFGSLSCAGTPAPAAGPAVPVPDVERPAPAAALVDHPPPEVVPGRSSDAAPPVIEYGAVSLAEREGRLINLVEDLVIEERAGDRRFDFDDAVGIVVDNDDRIYVHDSGRFRIVVYGPDGKFEQAYGGAGEMAPFRHGWIALAGEKLAISTGNKITVWTLDGRHLYDRSLLSRAFSRDVQGTVDGHLVGSFQMLDRNGAPWYSVEKISLEEDASLTYGAVSPRPRGSTAPRARAGFAATRTGEVYLTRTDEYVVQAFGADGAAAWILHVDAPPMTPGSDSGAPSPELSTPRSGRNGPGRGLPLRVDGHGNLYVFPYVEEAWDRDVVPVDVYMPDGERVFAGFISDRSWIRAQGDYVYGIEADPDPDSDGQRIVRYRLQAPPAPEGLR